MKRQHCEGCIYFNGNVFENGWTSKILKKASCDLGKRIIFINPKFNKSRHPYNDYGYVRYCDDFYHSRNIIFAHVDDNNLIIDYKNSKRLIIKYKTYSEAIYKLNNVL